MCGIIGFSGNNKKFSIDKVKMLMYLNSVERDSKDSTGFYTKEMKEPYKNIFSAKTMIAYGDIDKNLTPSDLLIAHVRKGSYGSVNNVNAHPFKVNNIIGVHNGTLTSVSEFCKKFEIKHEGTKTDSYHLFKALAKVGNATPLKAAEGTLAVLFTDNEEPDTLYVYRNNERLLYYGFIEDSMYISSEKEGLDMIGCTDVVVFEPFMFYTINKGKIENKFKVNVKASTTYKHDASLTGRWVRFLEDNTKYNISRNEFYFVGGTSYVANANQELKITDGFGLDGNLITEKHPITGIPRSLVDLTLDYDFNIDKTGLKCAKTVYNIPLKKKEGEKEAGEILANESIVVTKEIGYAANRTFWVYVPSIDLQISGVTIEDIRCCTKEEEDEVRTLLTTFDDDKSKEMLEKITFQKFNNLFPEQVNEALCDFTLQLVTELNKILEDKNQEDNKNKITKLVDQCEQVITDYIK